MDSVIIVIKGDSERIFKMGKIRVTWVRMGKGAVYAACVRTPCNTARRLENHCERSLALQWIFRFVAFCYLYSVSSPRD